jgi:hypothetical protein
MGPSLCSAAPHFAQDDRRVVEWMGHWRWWPALSSSLTAFQRLRKMKRLQGRRHP